MMTWMVFLLIGLVYFRAWNAEFKFDDVLFTESLHHNIVYKQTGVRSGYPDTPSRWRRDLGLWAGQPRRMTQLSLEWTWQLLMTGKPIQKRLDPFFQRWAWNGGNILLHAACTLELFWIVDTWFPDLALSAALLYAVHPVQVAAVAYLSGRSVLLMTFFNLALVLLVIHGAWLELPMAAVLAWKCREDAPVGWLVLPVVWWWR